MLIGIASLPRGQLKMAKSQVLILQLHMAAIKKRRTRNDEKEMRAKH
jgi:hypothetical protein